MPKCTHKGDDNPERCRLSGYQLARCTNRPVHIRHCRGFPAATIARRCRGIWILLTSGSMSASTGPIILSNNSGRREYPYQKSRQDTLYPSGALQTRTCAHSPPGSLPGIIPQISRLAAEPRPRSCVKPKGGEDPYRIRHGGDRIIHERRDTEFLIVITKTGHRRDAYRESLQIKNYAGNHLVQVPCHKLHGSAV